MRGPILATAVLLSHAGCAGAAPGGQPGAVPPSAAPHRAEAAEPKPVLPPREAMRRGWMPLSQTGVPAFLRAHPTYDGRGVLIAILDSGLDPGIPGLGVTSAGDPKILDLRDFSGEGTIALTPVAISGDELPTAGGRLRGAGRVKAIAVGGRVYVGGIAELPLGDLPASDLNGDHDDTDTLGVVVARATDGWVLFVDTDGDGSLANERPVHDFLVARETFAWRTGGRKPPLTLAANLRDQGGEPRLDLYFDTSAHGSHVAGIAAANDMYGVAGFDGVAPGAQLLGLKIANNAQGGISTTGSMIRAVEYAIRFARARRLPLVLNMSFGVGNEAEGHARIDQMVDSVLEQNPDVAFVISAGNDGPGLSTMGFPGSSRRAITVGATFPAVFLGATSRGGDPIAYFSSRGGESAKPDFVTPGLAYSTVPRWSTGEEQKGGTSMASPHAAGLVALLLSGLAQERREIDARQVRQALMVTARPLPATTYLDDGTGQPDVGLAWRWLVQDRRQPEVDIRAPGGGTAELRRVRLGTPLDSLQTFTVTLPTGLEPTDVSLRSSADWLLPPSGVKLRPGANAVTLRLRTSRFADPGVSTGVVTAWTRDTLAGPLFRLVSTVVVADTGQTITAEFGKLPAGSTGRAFFEAEARRPFAAAISTANAGEQVLTYLHEPGGQPYREVSGIGAGSGEEAGLFVVDGRDVVPGFYEVAVVAPPLEGAGARLLVQRSPVTIDAAREPGGVGVTLHNVSPDPVRTDPFVVLVGAERTARVAAAGTAVERLRFALPSWAVHVAVDVTMDREQWPRFTDFGVTLLGPDGRQLGKAPLNYAFGRLHVDLSAAPGGVSDREAEVALSPGLAEAASPQPWSATVSVRLYADSAHVSRIAGEPVTVAPGGTARLSLPMRDPGFALGPAFVPLGIVVVPEDDQTWTLEVPLPPPEAPLTP